MIIWKSTETERYNALLAQVYMKLKITSMELLSVQQRLVKSALTLYLNVQIMGRITKPPHLDV